ncbi:MAG: HAMP domain-containing sensor histidine kinase [Polyangiales bacterium]
MTTTPEMPVHDLHEEVTSQAKILAAQREVNAELIRAAIAAQELADEAQTGRISAEFHAQELTTIAEFREMFIGIVGHDLRTPLTSIGIGAAVLLRRGRLDAKDAETVERIRGSSQRMMRMITQLLDLTRARLGGSFPVELAPTDLAEVCKTAVAEFAEGALRLEVEGDLTGLFDADRVAELLSNIIRNGVEHATPGTVVVVCARADGAVVMLEVCNEGPAIAADVLPVIFEPFRRGRRERSKGGNLGLGLYIAHQIVLSHGGTLVARSSDGTTIFAARLPRDGVGKS